MRKLNREKLDLLLGPELAARVVAFNENPPVIDTVSVEEVRQYSRFRRLGVPPKVALVMVNELTPDEMERVWECAETFGGR